MNENDNREKIISESENNCRCFANGPDQKTVHRYLLYIDLFYSIV